MRIDARAGEHTGEAQKKFSNLIPVSASLSRFGDFNSGVPAQFIAHGPWSSLRMNKIFGRSAVRLATIPPGIFRDTSSERSEYMCAGEIATGVPSGH